MILTVTDQSSVALHILLHGNIVYTFFWFILEILLFVFKHFHLTYASHAFGVELTLVIMLFLNDLIRQYFGIKGNLMLQNGLLIIFIVYGLFCSIGFIFILRLQSYAQRLEILLSAISLLSIIMEILLSIITIIRNSRPMHRLTDQEKIQRLNAAQNRFQASIKNQ